ncbi:hypothetical protein AXG93_669s1450 [Marchantia polymorpha subsp. ruderalis]|uniref:Uncharacterized protein n=1 Tax=Marchantia polymorpha subsp. ruderalis TaxID=1480154 RepID=A0A176WBB3_MARPO|nr:hypothetical protein AXG93_669s1450 [Marchantia polymorpha subsp. ruderalis]
MEGSKNTVVLALISFSTNAGTLTSEVLADDPDPHVNLYPQQIAAHCEPALYVEFSSVLALIIFSLRRLAELNDSKGLWNVMKTIVLKKLRSSLRDIFQSQRQRWRVELRTSLGQEAADAAFKAHWRSWITLPGISLSKS